MKNKYWYIGLHTHTGHEEEGHYSVITAPTKKIAKNKYVVALLQGHKFCSNSRLERSIYYKGTRRQEYFRDMDKYIEAHHTRIVNINHRDRLELGLFREIYGDEARP